MNQDGCCSSYKYEMDGDDGSKITVGRHGTAADDDETWVNLPCNYLSVVEVIRD